MLGEFRVLFLGGERGQICWGNLEFLCAQTRERGPTLACISIFVSKQPNQGLGCLDNLKQV
jgi:hypothetical protein